MRILVGVTGGIAAYKSVQIVRELRLAGHEVRIVATRVALRFAAAGALEAIGGRPLERDLDEDASDVRHIALARWSDAIVVAPATADTIARLAAGRADDLLSATVLASEAPVLLAPAMHTGMWRNPATQDNVALLARRGFAFLGPEAGRLTSGDTGLGRMSEPVDIAREALTLARRRAGDRASEDPTPPSPPAEATGAADRPGETLAGRRIVVTAGGTREALDPVRFLGNRSTGRQGVEIAALAARRGALVTLIAAHLEVPTPAGVDVVAVSDAREMQQAVQEEARTADAVVMCAAVADFRPADRAERKIKKDALAPGAPLTLTLVRNPDILADLGAHRPRPLVLAGFAAETEPDRDRLVAAGRAKLAAKRCDLLVVNAVGWYEGFGTGPNTAFLLSAAEDRVANVSGRKADIAARLLDAIASRLGSSPASGRKAS